jgi:hypothetical protein
VTSPKTAADSFVYTASERRREERARAAVQKRATNRRAELQKLADSILEEGTECLASSSSLSVEEKNFVTDKRDRLIQALQNHDRVLEKMPSPSLRASLSFVLTEAIWASAGLARFAPPVNAISRREEYHRAAHARLARQRKREEKPETIALFDAVFASIGRKKVLRPTKIAVSILDQVNSQLISAGHKKVKLDVVRRVLEKLRALEERI